MKTVPFTKTDVKAYLDRCIVYWRKKRESDDEMANHYIDAFQSVRKSLFGKPLPQEPLHSDTLEDSSADKDSMSTMKWIPMERGLPEIDIDVLLLSKNGQWFTGQYKSYGSFRIISRCELQEDGSISQSTTSCHPPYFTHWMAIELPGAQEEQQ